jgi:hypothetical protein
MIDNYTYQPKKIPETNSGTFGLGGKPNEGSRGLASSSIDSGSIGGGGGGGDPFLIPGPQGPQGNNGANGAAGATGATGAIGIDPTINGVVVSNGDTNKFEILGNAPNSILSTNNSNELYWQGFPNGNNYGDMLFWDGSAWSIVSAASSTGISVLASSGGTPYWIETESCDTPP